MNAIEKFLAHHRKYQALYALLSDVAEQNGYNLSHAQIRLILLMYKGSSQVSAVAHALGIMPQTVGQTIKKTIQAGLIQKGVDDEDDTRTRAHLLTEEGRHLLAQLKEALETEKAQLLLK